MGNRYIFQTYIDRPQEYPETILYYDDEVLIIQDHFPKSILHFLVIPRSTSTSLKHPLEAFQDNPDEYAKMAKYVEQAKDLIMKKVISLGILKQDSSEQLSNQVSYQQFRKNFIRVGVHAVPSLRNLHIHVITQDFYSPYLKNKRHYNSFTTDFFVDFHLLPHPQNPEDLSLSTDYGSDTGEESDRLMTEKNDIHNSIFKFTSHEAQRYLRILKESPLKCRYCHMNFDNRFTLLKAHLKKEFMRKFNVDKVDALHERDGT